MKYFELVEGAIYERFHDTSIRQSLKLGRVAADVLNHGTLATAVQAIHDAAASVAVAEEPMVLDSEEGQGAQQPDANMAQAEAESSVGDIQFPSEEAKESYDRWQAVVHNKISNSVELVIRPANGSMDAMTNMFKNSKTFRQEVPEGHHHLHIYDGKTEGESKTQPAQRMPTNRPAYMAAVVGAAVRARCPDFMASDDQDALKLEKQCLYMFFDAFKHDNIAVFEKCFNLPDRKMTRHKKILYVTYEESTLLRRTRVRCSANLELDIVEHCAVISELPLELMPRKRLTMENSSNRFNHLGPVTVEDSVRAMFNCGVAATCYPAVSGPLFLRLPRLHTFQDYGPIIQI